jgi:lysophospholipid acyltransferase (LPLAT)-like uncharacterized protein
MTSRRKRRPKFKWYDPIIFYTLFPVLTFLMKLLLFTYRLVRVEGADLEKDALERSGGKAVYCSWHQRLVFHPYYLSKRGVTVMVSQSRDGEYAARLINSLGLGDVRGSSTNGGVGALKELTQLVKDGVTNGGMVVDGPLGPARVAKMGAVAIARNSGVPLMPIMWGTDRCWVFNSWDRFIIPKPFARIIYCHSEPIWVPLSAEGEELEGYRQQLEDRLNQAATWCDTQLGEEKPWRRVKKEGVPEIGAYNKG